VPTPLQLQELGTQFGELFYSHRLNPAALTVLGQTTADEAYRAQDAAIAFRVGRGESVAGYKVGCTSKSIQQQLGLTEPYCGKVMAPHVIAESANPIRWTNYVDLAIEPELVVRFGSDLDPERLADAEIVAAIESVSPGIELHHFKFWQGRATSQELIVSNGLFAGLVVGSRGVLPRTLDFQNEIFRVFKNGALVTEGIARDIMGGPLASLRWLARKLASRGERIRAGQIVIPGSPVALVRIDGDADVVVEITGVSRVQTNFRT
jgi:2-keto-4-pentenoate hydratase